MPDNRNEPEFTVTDRRRFNAEDDDVHIINPSKEVESASEAKSSELAAQSIPPALEKAAAEESPAPPSAEEQKASDNAFRESSKALDEQIKSQLGHSAKDFEMTFERFVASLYMTALMQLGLVHEQGGQPRVDLIGARQTIDTLTLLRDKTKGNLTAAEENLMQHSLYELQLAYVDVTNALTRAVQPASAAPGVNPFTNPPGGNPFKK